MWWWRKNGVRPERCQPGWGSGLVSGALRNTRGPRAQGAERAEQVEQVGDETSPCAEQGSASAP